MKAQRAFFNGPSSFAPFARSGSSYYSWVYGMRRSLEALNGTPEELRKLNDGGANEVLIQPGTVLQLEIRRYRPESKLCGAVLSLRR